jgi:hypothetical protein
VVDGELRLDDRSHAPRTVVSIPAGQQFTPVAEGDQAVFLSVEPARA